MDEKPSSLKALPTRRASTRYVVRIGAILRVGERAIEGTIVDISAGGLLVECAPPGVGPGTSTSIELRCFKVEPPVSMLAVHVRNTPAGCALRFADSDPFLRVFVKLVRLYEDASSDPLDELLSEV